MKVWRKKTVRWEKNGKRVPPKTDGSKKVVIPSKRFYGTLRDAFGKRWQVPLCEDKHAAQAMLRRFQTEADRKRAVGVDRYSEEKRRPINELVDEYETHLRAKANTETYVALTLKRVRLLLDATRTKTLADLDAGRMTSTLADWRNRAEKPIGVTTSNHYARAIKGLSRWLWIARRTIDDVLLPLRLLNAKTARRHVRRALTPDELRQLVHTVEASRKTVCGLTARDRAMLYVIAAYTGLRASELASLTPESFDLESAMVSVEACSSKRRRNDTLPLHSSLVDQLRLWLAAKHGPLWSGTWTSRRCANTARMVPSDLKRAGIAYRDEQGRVVDFHALRHTFITQLARSGVHPAKAKELARHSTIVLTMDVYSHVEANELRGALETLPPLT